MKNVTVKAVALAIAAALPSFAHALAAPIDLNTSSDPLVYAIEAVVPGTTVFGVTAEKELNLVTDLGFGVSNTQTRYIRFDFANAEFATQVSAADLTVPGGATVTRSLGGNIGESFVIFQITATAELLPTDEVNLLVDQFGLTMTSADDTISVTYTLYETGAGAQNQNQALELGAGGSADLAVVDESLSFLVGNNTTTESVATLYTTFLDGIDTDTALIGSVAIKTAVGVLDPATGLDVLPDGVLGSDTVLSVTAPDLSAAGRIFLDRSGAGTCATVDENVVEAVAGEGLTNPVELEIGLTTNDIPDADICFDANGATIAKQDFDIALVADPANLSVDAALLGTFDRDGTLLKAPWVGGKAGTASYAQLTNGGNYDADFQVICYKTTGATTDGASGTITAGNTLRVQFAAMGCPTGTQSVELYVKAWQGNVIGAIVRTNNTTGDAGIDSMTGNQ